MSFSASESSSYSQAFSVGPVKFQLLDFTANSGDTSGTITATNLSAVKHVLVLDGRLRHSAAPTFSANASTLAFVVPTETAASLIVQDLTYTAVANQGASGNSITIAYTAGAVAGSEVVTVTGSAISVQIANSSSTATQIRTKINASAAAVALITCTVSGTGSNAQVTASATPLAGGVTGGARGSILCIGV